MFVSLIITWQEEKTDTIWVGKIRIQIGNKIDHDIKISFVLRTDSVRSDVLDSREPVEVCNYILLSRRADLSGGGVRNEFWMIDNFCFKVAMYRIVHIPVRSKKGSKTSK